MNDRTNHRWLVLGVLCVAVFLVVVDNTIVNVALPTLSSRLGASNSALQWIVDGYSLPFAGLLFAGGGLSDRFGRRLVMQVALTCFAGFSLLAAEAHDTTTLLVARALMGAAAAFIFPATLSILTTVFEDPSVRAKAFGLWGATAGAAIAFGPIVGGFLLVRYWYGSIFLVNIPIVAVALLGTALVVPESRSPERRRFDVVGLVLGTLSVTVLVLATIEGPSWGWRSASTLGLFAVGALGGVTFAAYELRRDGPMLDVRLFQNRGFSAGAGALGTSFFCLFGFVFLVTQYFQLVHGYSALSAGVHTLPFAVTTALCTPLGAVAALRIGSRAVVSAGLAVMGVAMLWGATFHAGTSFFGPIVMDMIVLALGFSLLTAPATSLVMDAVTPEQFGAASAVNETTRQMGGTLGVAVLGSVFASFFGPQIRAIFTGTPLARTLVDQAAASMQAARAIVARIPDAATRVNANAAVTRAFMTGFQHACRVAGYSVLGVAVVVFVAMTAHVRVTAPSTAASLTNANLD